MFPRSTQAPVVNYAELSARNAEAPNSDIASLAINGVDEGTLATSKHPANEQYSIVQPGVVLTQIQPELDGELSIPEKPILKGGYADIYKGTWTRPDGIKVDVAIKTLRTATPASITTDTTKLKGIIDIRMKRETLIWKRANHRNIHTFLGFRLAYEPQLISPWCSNGNLSDYLVFNPQLSTCNKLKLVHQSALGLEFLHSRNPPICHGDIKPQNVLINDAREAALSDFGLSRVIEGWEIRTGLTTSGGGLKATNAYTAPELFTAEKPKSSIEADVYAFGGLILAVLSGQPPYHKIRNPAQVMVRVMNKMTPQPEEHKFISKESSLWPIMNACWNWEPSQRPSMQTIVSKLEEEIRCRREPRSDP